MTYADVPRCPSGSVACLSLRFYFTPILCSFYRAYAFTTSAYAFLKMKAAYLIFILHVLLTAPVPVNTFDPFTIVGFGVCASLGRTLWNYFNERCDSKWIVYNATGERDKYNHIQPSLLCQLVSGANPSESFSSFWCLMMKAAGVVM